MATIRVAFLSLVGVVVVGSLACSSDGSGTKRRDDLAALDTDAVAVADADDVLSNLTDATLDNPMSMGLMSGPDFHRPSDHPRPPGSHLGEILRRLEITREQLREILHAVAAHWIRVRVALAGLHEINQEIIDEANRIRERIKQALHAGEITREEAEARLRALSQRTREAIRSNPANERFLQMICQSRQTLFRSVRSVLDDRQKNLWDRWVASLDDRCLVSE